MQISKADKTFLLRYINIDGEITPETVTHFTRNLRNARMDSIIAHETAMRAIDVFNKAKGIEHNLEVVYCHDVSMSSGPFQIFDVTKHHFDIGSGYYFTKTDFFVDVHRKDGSTFRANSTYLPREIGLKCAYTNKYYYAPEFTRVEDCETGRQYCLEVAEEVLHPWPNNRYSLTPYTGTWPVAGAKRTIANYHSFRPTEWKEKQGIGMELEMYSEHRNKFIETLPDNILAEYDGSLCSRKGVELIGGPYTHAEYQNNQTPWSDILTKENVKTYGMQGYKISQAEGRRQYGIHLSLSRSLFTSLHAAKFIIWFNQQDRLVKLVAQRDTIYSGGYKNRPDIKSVISKTYDINSYDVKQRRFTKKVNRLTTLKYEPVFIDDKRLEVRVFCSNVRWNRVLKNIEFVQAVFDFTKNCGISVVATEQGTTEFLNWLNKQNNFYNLKKFLAEMKAHKQVKYGDTSFATSSLLESFCFLPKSPKPQIA